jgi:hypothetical protein
VSNTTIQIKRSATTPTPAGGTLSAAELAYSYSSNTLFIGTNDGLGTIAIGGKSIYDLVNIAFNTANAAYGVANSSTVANAAYDVANAAFGKANAANVLAYNTGIGANAYAAAVGVAANTYANNTFLKLTGGTLTGDLVVNANLTVTGETTYVNTQTLLVGDNIFVLNADQPSGSAGTQDAGMSVNRGSDANVSLLWLETPNKWGFTNDGTNYVYIASNTDIEGVAAGANGYAVQVGAAANSWANTVGASSNAYANVVGAASNTWANTVGSSANAYSDSLYVLSRNWANTVGASGNAYADVVGGAANTNAANGSYISTGIVKVTVGGTGVTSFTANGIIYGDGSNSLKVTGAGTDGQVLQSNQGVPVFAMLDGGVF